jgi:Putative prokaryotic signal transducing protein
MTRRGKVIPFPKRQPAPEPTPASASELPASELPASGLPASGLVEIRRCRDQSEALVVRALLDGHGIPAVMRGRLVQSVHPFSVGDAGEVTLLVHAVDADRARLILAGD